VGLTLPPNGLGGTENPPPILDVDEFK